MNAPARPVQAAGGFERLRSHRVETLNIDFEEYRHARTGARHYHLRAEDPNNAFMVAFPTVPGDSTGVAHILEHTTLCGSRRYPVRDPFFNMLRRSLNTYMNAFTSNDATAYPFATQNRKDFDNLLSVYLDAVFFPNLNPLDFAQEGHRLEFTDPENPGSPLEFKGIVYNEMKGAMSAPTAKLWYALCESLFATTTYHWNAGGDPRVIPTLTYEDLQRFHRRHYHPSNAFFFTYGDFPVAEHQARIEDLALRHFEARPIDLGIGDERRLSAPVCAETVYGVSADEGTAARTHVVIAWLLARTSDVRTMMRLRLLESVLLQDSAAPLRHALESNEFSRAPSELCGLEDQQREALFMCGVEGSEPQHADAVEQLVLQVIERVARDGVPRAQVEAALHQMEIEQRQIATRFPYGLQLIQRIMPAVLHGGEPVTELDIDPVLEELRRDIASEDFIARLARQWLLDNPHRVRLTMRPDVDFVTHEQVEERARLDALANGFTAADRRRVVEQTAALASRQAMEDDPDVLPSLSLADVPADIRVPEGEVTVVRGAQVTAYAAGTNGLVHLQAVTKLPPLDADTLTHLPLYWSIYTEVGCNRADYLELQARQTRTGLYSSHVSLRSAVDDTARLAGYFVMSATGLQRNHAEMARLMRELAAGARFDEVRRLRELVAQMRAEAEDAITARGHVLAAAAAARGLAPSARLSHLWSGLGALQTLKQMDRSFASDSTVAEFGARLARLRERLLEAPRQFLVVGDRAALGTFAGSLAEGWPSPGAASGSFDVPVASEGSINEAWLTASQVNFCARVYPAVPPAHGDAPALYVLSHFLRDGFLHRAIREQGGAYGGGATYDADSASFRFYSYRDPRFGETLADFDAALDWLQGAHPNRRIEEAILSAVKDLDQPSSPPGECTRAFFDNLHGRTPAYRRAFRARVLALTLADLQQVAERYLRKASAHTAVIGGRETLQGCERYGLELKTV